jgi:hypothetical protein
MARDKPTMFEDGHGPLSAEDEYTGVATAAVLGAGAFATFGTGGAALVGAGVGYVLGESIDD